MADLFEMFEELERQAPTKSERENFKRAPFGWPGSKWRSLDKILPLLPYRKGFMDVCGGSGVVMLNRRPSDLEVFNDRYAGITSFYRCLRDVSKYEALMERLRLTLHSREEFVWCRDTWENCTDDVERSARWYYMLRMSFGQLGRNFARATNGFPQHGRALQNSIDGFPEIHKRFAEVQIENLDALQLIEDYDNPDHVFYVDPDYIGTDNGIYEHGIDHKDLMHLIQRSKGFFAVSGYANDLYDSFPWDERFEWDVVVSLKAQAFVGNLKGMETHMKRSEKAREVLWIRESK